MGIGSKIAVLLAAFAGFLSCARTRSTSAGQEGGSLQIVAKPRQREVIFGGALAIETSLINRASTPIVLTEPFGESPFAFHLRSGDRELHVSQASYRNVFDPGAQRPRMPPENRELAPGKAARGVDDVALQSLGALSPGEWSVVAEHLPTGTLSAPATVTIRPASVVSRVSVWCPYRNAFHAALIEHQPAPVIHHRVTPSEEPRAATYVSTPVPRKLGAPTSVAVALYADSSSMGHWFAVTGNGRLTAGFSAGDPLSFFGGVDCAGDARLLPNGIQLERSARFVLLEAEKGARVRMVESTAERSTLGEPIALPAAPTHGAVQWSRDGSRAHVVIGSPQADGSIVSVVTLGRGESNAVRPIIERALPLLALEVKPRAEGKGDGLLHALFAASSEPGIEGALLLVVAGLDGTVRSESLFEPGERPRGVAVSAPNHETPWVAWATADGIFAARAGEPARTVAQVHAAESLRIFSTPGSGVWVEYVEPGLGVRLSVVPGTTPHR